MTEYIQYKGAGRGDHRENNSKEVCDWIHSRIQRKLGHGAERVFWIYGDNSIEIQLIDGTALTVKLGDFVTWEEAEHEDYPEHGYFQVITGEDRNNSWALRHRLGPSVNATRNDIKGLITTACHERGYDTVEVRALSRAEELLGVLEWTLSVLANVADDIEARGKASADVS